jgi:hypothetical protein
MAIIMNSTDAQENFGTMINKAQREPVRIERHGKPVAIVLCPEDFDALISGELTHAEKRFFSLNAEKWEAFMVALDAPPRETPRLKKLFQETTFFEK